MANYPAPTKQAAASQQKAQSSKNDKQTEADKKSDKSKTGGGAPKKAERQSVQSKY